MDLEGAWKTFIESSRAGRARRNQFNSTIYLCNFYPLYNCNFSEPETIVSLEWANLIGSNYCVIVAEPTSVSRGSQAQLSFTTTSPKGSPARNQNQNYFYSFFKWPAMVPGRVTTICYQKHRQPARKLANNIIILRDYFLNGLWPVPGYVVITNKWSIPLEWLTIIQDLL